MTGEISNRGVPDKVDTEEMTNNPGEWDTILSIYPQNGLRIELRNWAKGGEDIPVYGEFYDANGNQLHQQTQVAFKFDEPNLIEPEFITRRQTNIRSYRTLSLKEQQDAEKMDQVRHELKYDAFAIDDDEELLLCINSPDQIDWSRSSVYIEEDATRIVPRD